MKNVIEWLILIWTLLLVVLISGWICIEFYNLKVEIMAALIAFLGAIIGGFITLLGVRYTILVNQKEKEMGNIPRQVSYLRSEANNLFNLLIMYDTHKLDNEKDCEEVIRKYQVFLEKRMTSNLYLLNKELLQEHQKISDKISELTLYFALYSDSDEKEALHKEYLTNYNGLHDMILKFDKKINFVCEDLLKRFYS